MFYNFHICVCYFAVISMRSKKKEKKMFEMLMDKMELKMTECFLINQTFPLFLVKIIVNFEIC